MRSLIALAATLAPITATAQEAAAGAAGSPLASMLPMVLIFVIFYFLLIKPQQKKFKEHSTMLAALKKGDEVVTSGGIIGKVIEADKDGITTVEIAPGVIVKLTKQSISALSGASAVAAAPAKKTKKDSVVKNDNVVLKKDQIANDN